MGGPCLSTERSLLSNATFDANFEDSFCQTRTWHFRQQACRSPFAQGHPCRQTAATRRGTFIRDISLAEIGVIFHMRAKLEGLCVRYMRENASIDCSELLNRALKKLKAAAAKNNEEQFFDADMELHRTIWKAANQPLLYRTLNLLMNPYIFIIARAYSSRIPLANRRENHEQYVRMLLKTPLDKIEDEVERYFDGLYSRTFNPGSVFPEFATGEWTDDMHGSPAPPHR